MFFVVCDFVVEERAKRKISNRHYELRARRIKGYCHYIDIQVIYNAVGKNKIKKKKTLSLHCNSL